MDDDRGAHDRRDEVVELADGRALGYATFGDVDAPVVVYCHGVPGSRLLGAQLAEASAELGVRVVAPDRPGMGLSDFQPGRRIVDWPQDVAALLDLLGVERFTVIGVSGGGPYALGCGAQLADRVDRVGLVSPVVPVDAPGADEGLSPEYARLRRLQRIPGTTRVVMTLVGRAVRRSGDRMLDRLERSLSEPDRATLADPRIRAQLNAAAAEAFRNGSRGVARDIRLLARDWDVALADVGVPVDLWHGEQDRSTSAVAVRWLAETLPDCRAMFLPNAGHLWCCRRMDVVLRALYGPRGVALDEYVLSD